MAKIVVIGSTNTDMVVKARTLPKPGETVIGDKYFTNLGGKGANQAVAASRLGGTVSFVTKVGEDDFGKRAFEQFKNEGIDTSYVYSDSEKSSGVALITLSKEGENSIVVAPGANDNLTEKCINKTLTDLKSADIVLIQMEIPLKTVEYAIEIAKAHKIKVILNPAPAKKISDNALKGLYMITPNESEAEILTGIKVKDEGTARAACNLLREQGIEVIIITLGSSGAFVLCNEFIGLIPGKRVDAVDTTAAGDTFNGALAVAIAKGKNINEAVQFANCAAAISVTRMGAQSSIPKLNEMKINDLLA